MCRPVLCVCTWTVLYMLTLVPRVCEGQQLPPMCDPTTCLLPTCFCPGTRIPGGLTPDSTPQMVLFTFNDAVNDKTYEPLMELFGGTDRVNPGAGCPVSMTLFVSHTYTNYCQVAALYLRGHEVGSNSISHQPPATHWSGLRYEEYDTEASGQKSLLSRLAGIESGHIRGYRAPFLQPGGDTQYRVLRDRGFLYDSSLLVSSPLSDSPLWPYTLDFPYQLPCLVNPCPTESYPGLWELPLQPLPDHTGTPCSSLDVCMAAMTSDQMYEYLTASFMRHHSSNRAPLVLNMHARWLHDNDKALTAFNRFITDLVLQEDVYLVSASQLVAWMQQPTPLTELHTFPPWDCTPRTAKLCTKKVLRAGLNRTKKAGFEAYKSQVYGLIAQGHADGGRSIVQWVLFLFIAIFIYIHYKEAS